MTTIRMWSGREARALREAKRMVVREFAAYLGVSERTVSKWESNGGDIQPRPEMQSALDTCLQKATPEELDRFRQAFGAADDLVPGRTGLAVRVHRLIPVFVGPAAARLLPGRRAFGKQLPMWQRCRVHPLTGGDRRTELFTFGCGVVVAHVSERPEAASIGALCAWSYASEGADRAWAVEVVQELLGPDEKPIGEPGPVLRVHWLNRSFWSEEERNAALRLLCLPAVLVDRDSADGPRPVEIFSEQWLLAHGFDHPDIHSFGVPGASIGYASWAGQAYLAVAPKRALPIDEVIAFDAMVHMLEHYCRWLDAETDQNQPTVSSEYGASFLRNALASLTSRQEAVDVREHLLREAVMRATDLPQRLRQTHDFLTGNTES